MSDGDLEVYKVEILRDVHTRVAVFEAWKKDGRLHREGAPAEIKRDPSTGAVIMEIWAHDDRFHREDGPAFIRRKPDGHIYHSEWFLNGEKVKARRPARPSSAREKPPEKNL